LIDQENIGSLRGKLRQQEGVRAVATGSSALVTGTASFAEMTASPDRQWP
jgi:hypothetical protein